MELSGLSEKLYSMLEGSEDCLYKYCLTFGLLKYSCNKNVDVDFLDLSNKFLKKYRKSDKKQDLIISNILRKTAHKLYRSFFGFDKSKKKNLNFLNVIK